MYELRYILLFMNTFYRTYHNEITNKLRIIPRKCISSSRINLSNVTSIFPISENWRVGAYSRGGRLLKGWALTQGLGTHSGGGLFDNPVIRWGFLFEGALIRAVTVYWLKNSPEKSLLPLCYEFIIVLMKWMHIL